MIIYTCPHCNVDLTIDDQHAGLSGKCNQCGAEITVPKISDGTPPQSPPPKPEDSAQNQRPSNYPALASLVLGIGSWLMLMEPIFSGPGIVLGHVALYREKRRTGQSKFAKLSIPGLLLCYANMAVAAGLYIIVLGLFAFSDALDKSLGGDGGPVVVVNADETHLITFGRYRTAIVWDVETGEELYRLGGRREEIPNLRFSEDGDRIIYARGKRRSWFSGDEPYAVVDTKSGKHLTSKVEDRDTLGPNVERPGLVPFTGSGEPIFRFATDTHTLTKNDEMVENPETADRQVVITDTRSGNIICTLEESKAFSVYLFAVSDDWKYIASIIPYVRGSLGGIQVWDVRTGEKKKDIHGYNLLGFTPESNRVIGISRTRNSKYQVQLFDVETSESTFSIITK